jgi:hypothetical protein
MVFSDSNDPNCFASHFLRLIGVNGICDDAATKVPIRILSPLHISNDRLYEAGHSHPVV